MIVFFFHLVRVSRTQSVFSNSKYQLKIKNLLYPNQEQVEFDQILRFECKIRNENHFVENQAWDFFRANEFFLRRNFYQIYEAVNIL